MSLLFCAAAGLRAQTKAVLFPFSQNAGLEVMGAIAGLPIGMVGTGIRAGVFLPRKRVPRRISLMSIESEEALRLFSREPIKKRGAALCFAVVKARDASNLRLMQEKVRRLREEWGVVVDFVIVLGAQEELFVSEIDLRESFGVHCGFCNPPDYESTQKALDNAVASSLNGEEQPLVSEVQRYIE